MDGVSSQELKGNRVVSILHFVLAASVLVTATPSAFSQQYPNQPIRLIDPSRRWDLCSRPMLINVAIGT